MDRLMQKQEEKKRKYEMKYNKALLKVKYSSLDVEKAQEFINLECSDYNGGKNMDKKCAKRQKKLTDAIQKNNDEKQKFEQVKAELIKFTGVPSDPPI